MLNMLVPEDQQYVIHAVIPYLVKLTIRYWLTCPTKDKYRGHIMDLNLLSEHGNAYG